MARVLLFVGIGCCFIAVLMALISLDVDARGLSEVNPLGALALAVAALACFRGYELVRAHERSVAQVRSASAPQVR